MFYYEADSLNIDENDFTNYKRIVLAETAVFAQKLSRFSQLNSEEFWCVVTYLTHGKMHKSNPIRLKNETKPTNWTNEVTIEYPTTLKPKFTWSDFDITDNEFYFQVISDRDDDSISGTYSYDHFFQYYNTTNIVLNINTATPKDLVVDDTYNFTLMAVSADNWVNLRIQKSFVAE